MWNNGYIIGVYYGFMHTDANQATLGKGLSLSMTQSSMTFPISYIKLTSTLCFIQICAPTLSYIVLHYSCVQHTWSNIWSYATCTIDE